MKEENMKTVNEVSKITGISIRALRYYDEIGLLKPSKLSDTGYRLYDNKALEKLQEIMFYKELEISLHDIKKLWTIPIMTKTGLTFPDSFVRAKAKSLKWNNSIDKRCVRRSEYNEF